MARWPVSLSVIDILSVCHIPCIWPLSTGAEKSPQSQDETNTFALFPLAAGAGRCNWWLQTVTTWLQCHLVVTNTGRDAATQVVLDGTLKGSLLIHIMYYSMS